MTQQKKVSGLDKFFGVTAAGSSMKVEIMAGLTTFFAMAYIIFVNPTILNQFYVITGQTEMATARQFLLIGRCRNLKPEQVFNTANRIEKVVSEQGFETHRLKKAEIKRFLAVFFEASMNGDQMPDTDGEQFFEGEDSDEEET